MAKIVVVYHSGYGHTRVVADRILKGVTSVSGVVATLISVDELPALSPEKGLSGYWSDLQAADAIIMGCPTYMGTVSAGFKQFMERSSGLFGQQAWKDKIAAGFTNAGGLSGDKLNTLTAIAVFAAQHSMVWVSQGVFFDSTGINRMGAWLGFMSQSDNASPDQTPPDSDRRTAELFGARVATATLRWARGVATA